MSLVRMAKSSSAPGRVVAAGAHERADFVDEVVESAGSHAGLGGDVDALVLAVGVQVGAERHVDVVVFALAEDFALALADADDGVDFAIDAESPDRWDRRWAAGYRRCRSRRRHRACPVLSSMGVSARPSTTLRSLISTMFEVQPLIGGVVGGLLAVDHGSGRTKAPRRWTGSGCRFAAGRGSRRRSMFLRLLSLRYSSPVKMTGWHARDGQDVGSVAADFFHHEHIGAVDQGDDGDDRSHADDHADDGQNGAHLVRPERLERHPDCFGKSHAGRFAPGRIFRNAHSVGRLCLVYADLGRNVPFL